MAVEDFTTYTEQDGDGALSVTATKITATTFDSRDVNYWVISDKGAGHFGDFTHLVTGQATGASQSVMGIHQVSNTVGDGFGVDTANSGISTDIYNESEIIEVTDYSNNNNDFYSADNSVYYLTIQRSSTTYTVKIYSDSGRTNLLDTLSITCANTTFRYMTCGFGYNSGNGNPCDGYVENLDLQEGTSQVYPQNLMLMGVG